MMIITPYTYDSVEDIDPTRMPFPVLDMADDETEREVDADWIPTDTEWFVDSSGFGRSSEPAWTIDQFIVELTAYVADNPDHGFVITGVGQFQVYIRAFQRK